MQPNRAYPGWLATRSSFRCPANLKSRESTQNHSEIPDSSRFFLDFMIRMSVRGAGFESLRADG